MRRGRGTNDIENEAAAGLRSHVPESACRWAIRARSAILLLGRIVSSDLLALGVLTEARVRGIRVPEHLAVVGFGDLEFARDLDPSLTTVHIKGAAIGRQAAQFIVDRAEGRDVPDRVVDIGFHIVARRSA